MTQVHTFSLGTGRCGVPNETDLFVVPSSKGAGKHPVLGLHGAQANPRQYVDQAQLGTFRLTNAIADSGHLLIVPDFGGVWTWAGPTPVDRFDAYLGALPTLFPDALWDQVFLWGMSMGAGNSARIALDRPDKVKAVVTNVPLCDINDIRNRNALGSRTSIDAALGVVYPAPIPHSADILGRAQDGELEGLPWRGFYSSGDTVCPPWTVEAFVEAVGPTASATIVSNTEHSDPPIQATPLDEFIGFLNEHAA